MVNFTYYNPAKIIFGKDTEKELVAEIKKYGTRVLVHCDNFIPKLPVYGKVMEALRGAGLTVFELGGVVANPKLSLCYEGIKLCKKENIELILAVGGGSTIDSAKTIGAGVKYAGDVWDFYAERGISPQDSLPVGVVLTIPASGSESSSAAVVTNENGNLKRTAFGTALIPKFAVMNPENTTSLPPYMTACGGYDIISHLMERYFTKERDVDFTDRIIEGAIKTMLYKLPAALADPQNYAHRADIMWCGTNAHSGLFGTGRIGDWGSHEIAHELSAMYDTPHGAALSIVFPAWMKYVYREDLDRFVQFAQRVMEVDMASADREAIALEGIRRLEAFSKRCGLPVTLRDAGLDALGNDKMAEMTQGGRDGIGQFKKLYLDDVKAILALAQ